MSRASVTSSNLSSIWKIPSSSCPSKGSISSSFTADGGRNCASVFTVLSAHLVNQRKSQILPAVWSARTIENHCKLMWKRPTGLPWKMYQKTYKKNYNKHMVMHVCLYVLLLWLSQLKFFPQRHILTFCNNNICHPCKTECQKCSFKLKKGN